MLFVPVAAQCSCAEKGFIRVIIIDSNDPSESSIPCIMLGLRRRAAAPARTRSASSRSRGGAEVLGPSRGTRCRLRQHGRTCPTCPGSDPTGALEPSSVMTRMGPRLSIPPHSSKWTPTTILQHVPIILLPASCAWGRQPGRARRTRRARRRESAARIGGPCCAAGPIVMTCDG